MGVGGFLPSLPFLCFQIMGFEGEGKVNQTIYFPSPIDKMSHRREVAETHFQVNFFTRKIDL